MADRFQLETDITNLYNIADDIDLVVEAILERDMSTDDVANALLGISTMTKLRVDKAFDSYKAAFKLDEFKPSNSDDDTTTRVEHGVYN
jgi:ABC-type Fe3+ transport system substrate-binding protein